MFTHDGATIVRDTLYAVGPQGQVIVPAADVDSVLVKTFSTEKTVITAVSITVVLIGFFYLLTHHTATSIH